MVVKFNKDAFTKLNGKIKVNKKGIVAGLLTSLVLYECFLDLKYNGLGI